MEYRLLITYTLSVLAIMSIPSISSSSSPSFSFFLLVLLIINQYSVHQAFLSTKCPPSLSLLSKQQPRQFILFAETNTNTGRRLPLPLMEVTSLGLSGRWQEKAGNYILKPKTNKPLGVIHFLGGTNNYINLVYI